jgi:hypothetical protein
MNNPKLESDHEMGPIPAGVYLIGPLIDTKGGDSYATMRDHFELFGNATDWQYHTPLYLRPWNPRTTLNFHAGWTSEGCVTVFSSIKQGSAGYPGGPDWDRVLALMRRAGTTSGGYTYRYGQLVPGNNPDGRYIQGTFSGVMIVK